MAKALAQIHYTIQHAEQVPQGSQPLNTEYYTVNKNRSFFTILRAMELVTYRDKQL